MDKSGIIVIAGKEYFTFPEGLAQELKTSPRTARRWNAQRIGPPVIQIGNTQIVDPDDLPSWLESRKGVPRRGIAPDQTLRGEAA